jgi:hypothetical protein
MSFLRPEQVKETQNETGQKATEIRIQILSEALIEHSTRTKLPLVGVTHSVDFCQLSTVQIRQVTLLNGRIFLGILGSDTKRHT